MTKGVFHGNISGRELSRLLEVLAEAQLVRQQLSEPAAVGRPAERWVHQPRTHERNDSIQPGVHEKNETIRGEANLFVSTVGSSSSVSIQEGVEVGRGGPGGHSADRFEI